MLKAAIFILSFCASAAIAQSIDVEREIYIRDFERVFSIKNFRKKLPYVGSYHLDRDICVVNQSEVGLDTESFSNFELILEKLGSTTDFIFVDNLDLCSNATTVYFFVLENPNWFSFEKLVNSQIFEKNHKKGNVFQLDTVPEVAATYNHFSSRSQKPLLSVAYIDIGALHLVRPERKQRIYDILVLEELYQALTLAQDISWFEAVYSITHERLSNLEDSDLSGPINRRFEKYIIDHKPKGLCFVDLAFLFSIQNLEVGLYDIAITLKNVSTHASEAIDFAEENFFHDKNDAIDSQCIGPFGKAQKHQ